MKRSRRILARHHMKHFIAGDGHTVPDELWISCDCGALIWHWVQHFEETTENPDHAVARHLGWALRRKPLIHNGRKPR